MIVTGGSYGDKREFSSDRKMGTYFHGNNTSEVQPSAEGLQTLYLMNPNYVPPYSDAAQNPTPNLLYANPNTATPPSHALNLSNFSHAPPSLNHQQQRQQQHHLVGVTIPAPNILGSSSADTPTQRYEASGFHGFAAAAANAIPRVHYNLWGSVADQTATASATATPSKGSECAVTVAVTGNMAADFPPNIGFHRPIHHQRGLSLSLSSQQTPHGSLSGEIDVDQAVSPVSRGGDYVRVPSSGISSMHGVVLGSKYLKAAQEVMDEVVNVGKGICKGDSVEGANNKEKRKANIESSSGFGDGSSTGGGGGGENGGFKQGAELNTAQRQELQMKKSKLVSMLDEVELRYRQYHNQMQMVISSFEQAAGFGAAKSYTALALKTISKQFRSLKDAISLQIKTTSRSLGEDDCLGVKVEGSRLRYVDHHLRQQRALQQLGMIQHNAWRPQRGLPERAVSVLRAWLFEHFLHPYPKDSDKVMLARQAGLTRSQVSNWFINARVRLWKPMVEEMYMEEIKEQEQNNDSQDNTDRSKESSKELWSAAATATQESGATHHINVLNSKAESFNNQIASPTEISNSNNSLSTSPMRGSILSVDMEMKPGEANRESNTKFEVERSHKDGYPLMTGNENQGGGYGVFSMEDIGRFNVTEQLAPSFHGNGVSLTLGLPHNENLPLSATQHGFLSQNIHLGTNENEFCTINTTPPSSHSGTSYESIDIQNRKRFAAQLLRNFVA